jgi:hypothetical protein
MKKLFPIILMIIGLAFLVGGSYTVLRGFDAREQVKDELAAQAIVTPDDASIPGVPVSDAATAKSMADIIDVHSREITGGRSYAELGRYLTPDGDDTSDEALALKDSEGNPVANPVRDLALTASTLRTSLYTTVMAFNVADLVIGLGLAIAVLGFAVGGIGVVLASLAIPSVARRFHVRPLAAPPAA